MRFLDRLIDRTRSVSRYAVWIAGLIMLASVFYVGAEVISRRLGLLRITGATEVGGFMLAVCSAWAFSFTLLNRSNIRFDPFYWAVPARVRTFLDVVALLAMGTLALTISYYAYEVMHTSFRLGSRSSSGLPIPLWLPQALWFAGFVFLCWTVLVLALRTAGALIVGDHAHVAGLVGMEMADEEVERETHSAQSVAAAAYAPEEDARDGAHGGAAPRKAGDVA